MKKMNGSTKIFIKYFILAILGLAVGVGGGFLKEATDIIALIVLGYILLIGGLILCVISFVICFIFM